MSAQVAALALQLEMTQWWPPELIRQHQLRQAGFLLSHAFHTVPLYRDRLQSLTGVRGELTIDDFRQLPILTRQELQAAGEDVVSTALPDSHGEPTWLASSGSTGRPVRFQATRVTGLFYRALGLRFHLWHQRDLSRKNLSIRPMRKTDKLIDGVAHSHWGDLFHDRQPRLTSRNRQRNCSI